MSALYIVYAPTCVCVELQAESRLKREICLAQKHTIELLENVVDVLLQLSIRGHLGVGSMDELS